MNRGFGFLLSVPLFFISVCVVLQVYTVRQEERQLEEYVLTFAIDYSTDAAVEENKSLGISSISARLRGYLLTTSNCKHCYTLFGSSIANTHMRGCFMIRFLHGSLGLSYQKCIVITVLMVAWTLIYGIVAMR